MLGRVVVENGVKKIVPLTADCGSGNPVGTVIAVYSNKVPNGYLPCNGVQFDTAQFPVLYALLQDDHTPDLRECVLVGAGTSDRTMGAHDVYTVGQFKDDQIQNITGSQEFRNLVLNGSTNAGLTTPTQEGSLKSSETTRTSYTLINTNATTGTPVTKLEFDASLSARTGTTTHGKQVGVNWCIKATSGINENQADNVLSALSPVNAVTSGDMHAVTSNAVAGAISALDVSSVGGSGKYISAISETDGKINATASDLATSVASGNNAPVTSDAVNSAIAFSDLSYTATSSSGTVIIKKIGRNQIIGLVYFSFTPSSTIPKGSSVDINFNDSFLPDKAYMCQTVYATNIILAWNTSTRTIRLRPMLEDWLNTQTINMVFEYFRW